METKTNGAASGPVVAATTPAPAAPPDIDVSSGAVRTRIAMPTGAAPRPSTRDADAAEIERLARRYSRETQLALEGLLFWALRWPFELLGALVTAGRRWEEDYNRPAPKRRVSLYDEES